MPMLTPMSTACPSTRNGARTASTNAPRNLGGGVSILDRFDEHGEFVPANSRERIAVAETAAESGGHHLQQAIAARVTERVVDELEAIEVEKENRDRARVLLRVRQRHARFFVEQHSIRQAGEGVVKRLMSDPAQALAKRVQCDAEQNQRRDHERVEPSRLPEIRFQTELSDAPVLFQTPSSFAAMTRKRYVPGATFV